MTNSANNPLGATFYLDDIQYNKKRLDELRFPVSYETLSFITPDRYIKNTSFIYDDALVMLAYMARGSTDDWRRRNFLLMPLSLLRRMTDSIVMEDFGMLICPET